MQAIRVATWNAEGMFVEGAMTRRASPHDAIATLKLLDADIVAIPEFGVNDKLAEPIRVAIGSLGYQLVEAPYDDPTMPDHVPKQYEMALLSRLPLRSHTLHHFDNSGRVFIEAHLEMPNGKSNLRVFAVHLDDKSENLRLQQIDQLLGLLAKSHVGETILMGDFNAMSGRVLIAKTLRSRSAGFVGKNLPTKQLRSMSERVNQMAIGTTIARLKAGSKLHDLDNGHHYTISAKQMGIEWIPALRLAKIDWIFGSNNIHTNSYKVLPDVGSDHRPVLATLTVK